MLLRINRQRMWQDRFMTCGMRGGLPASLEESVRLVLALRQFLVTRYF
jgi:hypothetical protein